jgi:uncharacterized Zn finger protein (UPF0148 family)
MQASEAAKLPEEWGEKPCNHDHIEKEYYLGAHTGEYVCITCGRNFTSMEKAERDRQRQRDQNPDASGPDANSQ